MDNQARAGRPDGRNLSFVTTSDGVRLAYRRTGVAGAPRIALIHSLALDGTVWDDVVAQLANKADIVCIDCRGHGASDRPAGPYSVERFADDLADLMHEIGWEDAIVAGCSMGGCVAQSFAARHALRTAALAVIDTTAWYGATAREDWQSRAEKAGTEGFASMAQFQTTRWFGDSFRAAHPETVQAYIDVFVSSDVDAYAATCGMMGALDLRSACESITAPTAIIVGEEDYAAPPQMAEELAGLIRGSTLTILPGARHLTPIECPDRIAAKITELIART